jgi:hypothetical protein
LSASTAWHCDETLNDAAFIDEELAELTGRTVSWTVEPLVHNPKNAVTAGISRVSTDGWSAVLKVVSPGRAGEPHWAASHDQSHWNYWRREAYVYESDLAAAYRPAGLDAPKLLGRVERANGEIALWLEDVAGTAGAAWPLQRYAQAARSLGLAQGRLAVDGSIPQLPWLSRGFLRAYSGSQPADWRLLEDDDAWRQPLVRDHFPPGLREQMLRLHRERERFLGLIESLPRTLCHLDVWPHNLIARDQRETVLLDWAFVGDGALGEDIGNLIPDTIFDLFLPADRLPELDELVYGSYLKGLRAAGWAGDERLVRVAVCASAVKYTWLVPFMLSRASDEEHPDYGGAGTVSAARRYSERGATFMFLAGWADEARELARTCGR